MTKRRTLEPVPTPANWFSVGVNDLTVYRVPRDDSYTVETQVPLRDADGDHAYTADGSNHEYFAEGTQPEGYEAVTVSGTKLVARTKRGDVSGITITEEDADGNVIPRSKEGYAEFLSFNMDGLRTIAEANPATVGLAYQEAVEKLQALAGAIYDTLNAE